MAGRVVCAILLAVCFFNTAPPRTPRAASMSTSPPRPPPASAPPYTASGFFALRTPLLPFDVLTDWGRGLTAWQLPEGQRADALTVERSRLRESLRRQVADPVVRE